MNKNDEGARSVDSNHDDVGDSLKGTSDHTTMLAMEKKDPLSPLSDPDHGHGGKKKVGFAAALKVPRKGDRLLKQRQYKSESVLDTNRKGTTTSPSAASASQANTTTTTATSTGSTWKNCKICTKKPLRRYRGANARKLQQQPLQLDYGDPFLFDGFAELIYSMQNEQMYSNAPPSIALSEAESIVERASRKVKDLLDSGKDNVRRYAPDDKDVYQNNSEVMGKFEWKELEIGDLLGVGGFSNVSEITGFKLKKKNKKRKSDISLKEATAATNDTQMESHQVGGDITATATTISVTATNTSTTTKAFTRKEQLARKFLAKHAKRPMPSSSSAANNEQHSIIDDASQKSTKSLPGRILSNSSHSHSNHGDTITDVRRYAIKHLRPGLHRIYDQRTFNCAAVDLIMEAHILLSLQVPYEGS